MNPQVPLLTLKTTHVVDYTRCRLHTLKTTHVKDYRRCRLETLKTALTHNTRVNCRFELHSMDQYEQVISVISFTLCNIPILIKR